MEYLIITTLTAITFFFIGRWTGNKANQHGAGGGSNSPADNKNHNY